MKARNLNDWLCFLEHRHTQEIRLGLSRILKVAQKSHLQTVDCKVITVAGTNGKGSTVSALERIYHTAGYRVGTYTSPHLLQFNERIRVSLLPISDEDLCIAFTFIEESRGDIDLSYFEMTTLAALWHFKQQNLDVILLEVGLGGRLDATNIIDADLAIITTIDLDHQAYLGDTLEAIGYEKAGILRANKPFIYADINPPSSVVDLALRLNTVSYFYDKAYSLEEGIDSWEFDAPYQHLTQLPKPKIQLKSAAAALMASFILEKDLPISPLDLRQAMENIFIPGRLQLDSGDINLLYDVSHNPQSARLLAQRIGQLTNKAKVHAVFSALIDKDIFGLIVPLKDCVNHWYPAQLESKRAAGANQLLSCFSEAEILVDTCYNSPLIAFKMAMKQAQAGDLIVVYGSFFTVSQVMAAQYNLLEYKENQ